MLISFESLNKYYDLLQNRLSKELFAHSIAVKNESVKLANKYKADADKCLIAGLLLDVCKETPFDEMERAVASYWSDVSEIEFKERSLWHAIAGAVFTANELKVHDNEILSAIRFHTMAKRNMTLIEKIVFVASYISQDQDYEGVSRLRLLAYNNLDKALMEAIGYTISNLTIKGMAIPHSTYECYNQLVEQFRYEK